jgi:glycosyltransferase involved in cell wall biosynthesis
MKICHIITRLIVGGAQENTVLSCAGLAAAGHDVTLVAGPETGPEGSLWDDAAKSGAELVRLESLRRSPSPRLDMRCLGELTGLLRDGAFDIVHTHSSKAGILGRRAARRAGTPVVVHTIHGMSFNRTQPLAVRWFYRRLERWAARYTDAFVSVADAMTDQAVAARLAPRDRFNTIYSGIRTDRYEPNEAARFRARERFGVEPHHIVAGTVARLFRNKGYEELIAAMPQIAARAPLVRFVWVGDGAQRDEYLSRVEAAGLRDRVLLAGLVPPEEIPVLIAGFDLLVHASRWEGLPRVLVQALLMQVSGASFDNDGAPEVIVNNETGLLVPFGNVSALADAVVHLAESPALRRNLGLAGRARCLDRFNAERMVKDLDRLYQRLLGESGRQGAS